ncbi:hypothetical protein SDD30_14250 [Moorella naiadis]|uniref:hypothetical protein n=1 Tax=Moorella naiadis (nom. illeg.) TaxID=3093670 RepID=UPI003D9C922B
MAGTSDMRQRVDFCNCEEYTTVCGQPAQYGSQPGDFRDRFRLVKKLKKLKKDERGSSLDFLIAATLIFFMLFAGADYYTALVQHQIAEHIMHYYLERIRIEGCLIPQDQTDMVNKFAAVGLTVENINAPLLSGGRVLRNPQDPDGSRITVTVTLKPKYRPFLFGALVGGAAAPNNYRIVVGGSVLSERVTP